MSPIYSLRALFVGAAHIAVVLSITGATGAERSTLASGVKPAPIVALDRHEPYDTNRVLVLSDASPTRNLARGQYPRALLNGESQPKPMWLRLGVTYRLRLMNIRADYAATVSIFYDGQFAEWRVIAKNGADLPPSQAIARPATLTFAAGEIYDVEFTPTTPGSLTLQFGTPKQGPIAGQATDVQVVVR